MQPPDGPSPGGSSTTIPHQNPPPTSSSTATDILRNPHGAGAETAVAEDGAEAHVRLAGAASHAGSGTSGALLTAVVCVPAQDVAQDVVMEVVVRAQGAFVPTVVWTRSGARAEEEPAPATEGDAAALETGSSAAADAGAAVLLLTSADRVGQRSTASGHRRTDTYDIELLDLPPRPGLLLVRVGRESRIVAQALSQCHYSVRTQGIRVGAQLHTGPLLTSCLPCCAECILIPRLPGVLVQQTECTLCLPVLRPWTSVRSRVAAPRFRNACCSCLLRCASTPAQLELRWDGEPGHPLPVVLTDDAGVGRELQHACATWAGSGEELDDLLLDLGTWSYHTAVTAEVLEAQAAAAAATGGGGGGAEAGAEAEGRLRTLQPLQARLGALGVHLLRHAEACGWSATVAWMQRTLEQQAYDDGVGGGTAPSAEAEAVAAAAEGVPEPQELERAVVVGHVQATEPMKDGVEAGAAAAAAGAATTVYAHADPSSSLRHAEGLTRMERAIAEPDGGGSPSRDGAEPQIISGASVATPPTCASQPHTGAQPRGGAAAMGRGARASRAVQVLWAWLALLLQVLGLRPTPAHERAEYEAYTASWHAAGAFTM